MPFLKDDFLATREIRSDDNIKTRLTGQLPDWATALKQPQSGSVIRGGASSVATTPGNTGSRNAPANFTSSEDESKANSSSSDGIYFTPDYVPPVTQDPARSPSPVPATGSLTIKIPPLKQQGLGSPAPISDRTREKLKKQFLLAKAKAAAEKALTSAYVPPESPKATESSAPLFSPYTTWIFSYSDELYAEMVALPSLTSRIETLSTAMPAHIASGSLGNPSNLSSAPSDAFIAQSVPGGSGSCSTPTMDAVTNSASRKASSSVLKKRVVHEISSDSDNDADDETPVKLSAKVVGKGKAKASASSGKKSRGGSASKKRKSSD